MTNAEQTAANLTIAGIEGLIRNAERQLEELDGLDPTDDLDCNVNRDLSRVLLEAKLASARTAMTVKHLTLADAS